MILASNNAHKLEEFRAIFADMGIEIIPQSAAGCHFEVDETGETFEENAYLKAIAVTRATGQPAVADDSGLMVDALGGAPGVHSARYTGRHEDSDAARYTLLLHGVSESDSYTAVCLRIKVIGDAEGCSDLILTSVSLSDIPSVIKFTVVFPG